MFQNNTMLSKKVFKKSIIKTYIIISYIISSLILILLNKYIVTRVKQHFLILVIQNSVIILISLLLRPKINTISINWIYCACFFILMIYTGNKSIEATQVSVMTMFKNISIIIIAIMEWILYNRKISIIEFISFIMVIYGLYDGSIYIPSIWIILNICTSSIYVIILRHTINTEKSNSLNATFTCNVLSIPILFICSLIYENFNIQHNHISIILLSGIVAFCVSLFTMKSLNIFSSTSYSMMGALNKLLVSFSGILFLNENITILKVISIFIGFLGTILYAIKPKIKLPIL